MSVCRTYLISPILTFFKIFATFCENCDSKIQIHDQISRGNFKKILENFCSIFKTTFQDPNNQKLLLYSISEDDFSSSEEEDSSDESDESDGEKQ